jgi:hypothetical protein
MSDVIEVSYTGDLLAHRRCARAWAYEKYAGFHPYEQVQAMEGRLVHHAMEWLARFRREQGRHAGPDELRAQLDRHFKVLWARGVRTAFAGKAEVLDRVVGHVFPGGALHPTVRAATEGALHTEYELRAVRKLVPLDHDGKRRLLLTGVLDLVVQQQSPLRYGRVWEWTDPVALRGRVAARAELAGPGDLEVWDYKGSRAGTDYLPDYVLQLLTYANLYRERTGSRPARCVLFFVNEPDPAEQLLAVPLGGDDTLLAAALDWTLNRVKELQATVRAFRGDPAAVPGGDGYDRQARRQTVSSVLSQQCQTCGQRFGCRAYVDGLPGKEKNADVSLTNVFKN